MVTLTSFYDKRMATQGFPQVKCNTTRLREDIVRSIPDIKAVMRNKRSWSLVYDKDLSSAVANMSAFTEASILHKAAKIIRKDCLQVRHLFTGSFSDQCDRETESLPFTLRSFLHILLNGSGTLEDPCSEQESNTSKVVSSIGQQIIFNSVERRSGTLSRIPRHIRYRETPAVIYLAMKLYLKTGSRSVMKTLHKRGLCIAYKRLLTLSTDIANSIIEHWNQKGVVVPPQAVQNVFTTGGFDNIDHNPSSTTAKYALHGACISIHQHFSSDRELETNEVEILNQEEMGKASVKPLPVSYTNLDLDIALPKDLVQNIPDLGTSCHHFAAMRSLKEVLQEGYSWLETVRCSLAKQKLERNEWISWAAYYASKSDPPVTPPATSYMLPLFTESPNNPAMVWHAMKIIRDATAHINPGQTPVMEADQPLFTLAKKLQWKNPDTEVGESTFLVTLGAMHTEKMLWSVSGDWLDGSGWVSAITNSGVATSGKAQSFIGVHHICRTRYIHQVSVAALYSLLTKAYESHVNLSINDECAALPFQTWLVNLRRDQPQADYWFKAMELDLLILEFVKSCRKADFNLYIETLNSLLPWVFALDHTHYARNLPVHLRDMVTLETQHPALYQEFKRGNFVGQKSRKAFSCIPRDQMHEQLIDWLKNHAGVIENLDDPTTVRREQVVRPEMARLVREFEGTEEAEDQTMHHEQYLKFQIDFQSDVVSLVDAFEQLGNPFLEDTGDLIDLDQSIIMPFEVVNSMRNIEETGKELYSSFLNKRICSQEEAFTATMSKSNIKLFKTQLSEPRRKSDASLINDQHNKGTMILLAANSGRTITESLFSHDCSTFPHFLTAKCKMYREDKSEILDIS